MGGRRWRWGDVGLGDEAFRGSQVSTDGRYIVLPYWLVICALAPFLGLSFVSWNRRRRRRRLDLCHCCGYWACAHSGPLPRMWDACLPRFYRMKRRTGEILGGLSLLLCLATGGLWVRSYFAWDKAFACGAVAGEVRRRFVDGSSAQGRLSVSVERAEGFSLGSRTPARRAGFTRTTLASIAPAPPTRLGFAFDGGLSDVRPHDRRPAESDGLEQGRSRTPSSSRSPRCCRPCRWRRCAGTTRRRGTPIRRMPPVWLRPPCHAGAVPGMRHVDGSAWPDC